MILTADQVINFVRSFNNIPSDSISQDELQSGVITFDHLGRPSDTVMQSFDLKDPVINICDASGLSTHDIVIREVVMDSQSVKVSSRSRLCQNQKFVFMTTKKQSESVPAEDTAARKTAARSRSIDVSEVICIKSGSPKK